jgi:hypothetical protein
MKTATLRNLGIKFIGLYCAASGLSEWFDSMMIVLDYSDSGVAWESILRVGRWFSLFTPVVLILFGLYLIKDGVLVKNFAFRDVRNELSDSKQIFETGLGLLGVFMIASTISSVLSILINLGIVIFAPVYLSVSTELDFVKFNLISCLASVGLGVECVRKRESLSRMAFDNASDRVV